jgi:predicted MPP superfamily phosphohydrolase
LLALLAMACALAVDAFWIEPYALEVTHGYVHAPLATPLKIAHLSDLHTHGLGRRERKMLAALEAEKPDLIVITGDTISGSGTYEMCREVLAQLHAPLGVWLVRGNWENWRPLKRERAFYDSAGVHFLLNAGRPVRADVWLVGLDDPWTGAARPGAALAAAPPGSYVIALFHSPFYFDYLAGRCNLALAGHTHGGQVWLPGLVGLWLPGGCGRYLAGWYEDSGSRMYVSRGLGTSNLPVRFLCRPELAIITVGP